MLINMLKKDKVEQAIELLDQLNISVDMFKEHLMDLCMNKKITE
jgi:predicted ArsR family transcriptional regulator